MGYAFGTLTIDTSSIYSCPGSFITLEEKGLLCAGAFFVNCLPPAMLLRHSFLQGT